MVVNGGVGISSSLNVGQAISAAAFDNTINGIVISSGAISSVTTLSASGAISAAAFDNTINGIVISSGAISSVTTLSATDVIRFTSGAGSDATGTGALVVSGGVGIGGSVFIGGQANANTFNATSDYRMKKDIKPLASSKTIDLLKPVEYSMTDETYQMGFLAHEVQEIFPFLVTGEKDGEKMQSLNYNGFIALLVKEIQDLKSENKLFKSRLDAIENIIGDDNEKSRLERFRDAFHHAR